jgi:hypothetical protein
LWRVTLKFDALSGLHRIADFHASIAKHLGIDNSIAGLKLSVAITNLNLQIPVRAADATFPICWNLQKHLSVENHIIRLFDLDLPVNLVRRLNLPTP